MKLLKHTMVVDLSIILNAAYFVLGKNGEVEPYMLAHISKQMLNKCIRIASDKNSQILLATDLGDSWRKQYVVYKQGRPEKEDYYAKAAEATNILQKDFDLLAFEGCEADDFAFIIASYAHEQGKAILVSSDNDWRLLSGLNEYILIFDRSKEVFYSRQCFKHEIVKLALKGSHNGISRGTHSRISEKLVKQIADDMQELTCQAFYNSACYHLGKANLLDSITDNFYYVCPSLEQLYDELGGLYDYLQAKNILKKV